LPCAQNKTAHREGEKRAAHIDQNERPWVCFEGGESRNGSEFHKEKSEPTTKGDFQSAGRVARFQPADQPGQTVIDRDRCGDRYEVRQKIMRLLDVSHRLGVITQPELTKNGIPTKPDQLMQNDQNPDGEVVNLVVHETP
jgi:hypothetical protein